MTHKLRAFLLALAALAALHSSTVFAATNGLRIKDGPSILVEVWDGVAAGEISVPPGETSATLEIFWLDENQVEFQPGAGFSLGRTGPNPAFITWNQIGTWTFTVEGLAEGSSLMQLSLLIGVTTTYTSPDIDVHCEEAHVEADGLVLYVGGVPKVVVWQGTVTGQLIIQTGLTSPLIEIQFLDADSIEFQPSEPDFDMDNLIGNGVLASETEIGDWSFTLDGLSSGLTNFQVRVFHVDHYDFTSPDFDLIVTSSAATGAGAVAEAVQLRAAPNPVTPATAVQFALERAGRVSLAVFDTQGRRVSELADRMFETGVHSIAWDGSGLSNGVYFVNLVTPGGVRTQRVVIAR